MARSLQWIVLACLASAPAFAQPPVIALGGLDVLPTRVVLEGSTRSAALTLRNTGSAKATYRIAFIELKMDEQGQLLRLPPDAKPQTSAADFIRYSPRQVTLEPGSAQTVRLQLRKPGNLPEGEYRSHLTFTQTPDAVPPSAVADAGTSNGLGVQLNAVFGISIPVIVRHGNTQAQVAISDVKLLSTPDGAQGLEVYLRRSGNASVYGNLTVTGQGASGEEVLLSQAKGVGVYDGLARRQMKLTLPPDFRSKASKLFIRFSHVDGRQLAAADVAVR